MQPFFTGVIALVVAFLAFAIVMGYKEAKRNMAKWNNGFCTKCDGELFIDQEDYNDVIFTYHCVDCDHSITTTWRMDE